LKDLWEKSGFDDLFDSEEQQGMAASFSVLLASASLNELKTIGIDMKEIRVTGTVTNQLQACSFLSCRRSKHSEFSPVPNSDGSQRHLERVILSDTRRWNLAEVFIVE
jgi:hypothetical protein